VIGELRNAASRVAVVLRGDQNRNLERAWKRGGSSIGAVAFRCGRESQLHVRHEPVLRLDGGGLPPGDRGLQRRGMLGPEAGPVSTDSCGSPSAVTEDRNGFGGLSKGATMRRRLSFLATEERNCIGAPAFQLANLWRPPPRAAEDRNSNDIPPSASSASRGGRPWGDRGSQHHLVVLKLFQALVAVIFGGDRGSQHVRPRALAAGPVGGGRPPGGPRIGTSCTPVRSSTTARVAVALRGD
jgi:hypothetical protein